LGRTGFLWKGGGKGKKKLIAVRKHGEAHKAGGKGVVMGVGTATLGD